MLKLNSSLSGSIELLHDVHVGDLLVVNDTIVEVWVAVFGLVLPHALNDPVAQPVVRA